ncbi:hypothetical protein [Alkalihalophilus marmarensis]|uniref:Uncharacterized protein n=1 Tax=Alkalihalophilus marmarensis DSM 21297 TaxID=1188261 RepID=U6SIR7_9BACI|nr:hypothetical protein [Alkalihalophilus marmarensis]ERN51624.1 hypothetical protein A33I_20030 [Alkalihalophilus marmarensis DSM 21297]
MANKTIFRQYVEARELIEDRIRLKEFHGEDDYIERHQLALLKMIFKYIKDDDSWTKQARSREKAIIFIRSSCNYTKTKEEIGAKSKNSVEASVSYLSKKLANKIGADTIDLIVRGKIEEALTQFHICTGKVLPSNYMLKEFLELLPQPKWANLSLAECKKEIKLLLIFSKVHIERRLGQYNEEKLAYIMYILTSNDHMLYEERKVILQLLSGDVDKGEQGKPYDFQRQIQDAIPQA